MADVESWIGRSWKHRDSHNTITVICPAIDREFSGEAAVIVGWRGPTIEETVKYNVELVDIIDRYIVNGSNYDELLS